MLSGLINVKSIKKKKIPSPGQKNWNELEYCIKMVKSFVYLNINRVKKTIGPAPSTPELSWSWFCSSLWRLRLVLSALPTLSYNLIPDTKCRS